MPRRLIVIRTPVPHTLVLLVFIVGVVALISSIPWSLQHLDAARNYLDPRAKTAYLLFGGGACILLTIFLTVQALIGLRWTAALFGSQTARGGLLLMSPFGLLGYPPHRLHVRTGRVRIVVATVARPVGPYRRHGPQTISIQSGGRTLRLASVGRCDAQSLEYTVRWLDDRGIVATVEHVAVGAGVTG